MRSCSDCWLHLANNHELVALTLAMPPRLAFFRYAASNVVIALFVLLMVPETKGQTLEQIQAAQQAKK